MTNPTSPSIEKKDEVRKDILRISEENPDDPAFIDEIIEYIELKLQEVRAETIRECIEALPEEIDMQRAIDANSDAGAGHVIGHNHLLRDIKSSLTKLL